LKIDLLVFFPGSRSAAVSQPRLDYRIHRAGNKSHNFDLLVFEFGRKCAEDVRRTKTKLRHCQQHDSQQSGRRRQLHPLVKQRKARKQENSSGNNEPVRRSPVGSAGCKSRPAYARSERKRGTKQRIS
jgi:hypothetical protein